ADHSLSYRLAGQQVRALGGRMDVGDAEGALDAVVLGDRHVLAGHEGMLGEAEDRLIVVLARPVGEQPGLAAMMPHQASLGVLVGPEAAYSAFRLVARPGAGIEPAVGVERCDELVAATTVARRRIGGAGELKADFLQGHGILVGLGMPNLPR